MLNSFLRHLEESNLIPADTRLVVGYSGGADSTCLLHLLHSAGFEVIAAHLHHGQRPEAEKEMKLCEAFCEELGIPFVGGRADVPRMSADLKIGIEEAGRMARYNFLDQALKSLEYDLVCTAHTRTDHVETMLLNLARGTGPQGLTGIPARRDRIVRPLLFASREETRAYCQDLGLWFHDEPGNENLDFSRVRVRQRIVPEFSTINSQFELAATRCAAILDEEDRFLNGSAAAALEQYELPLNGELQFLTRDVEFAFNKQAMTSLPPVLFKRAIRLGFQALGAALDYDQTELVADRIMDEKGSLTADGGEVVVEWNRESIHFRVLRPTEPYRFNITLPGETESLEFGWKIVAERREGADFQQDRASLIARIPAHAVQGELYFRSAQPGDSMPPLGFTGTRKVSDLLSDAKLSHAARARLPLICDFLGPIWLPGVALSHRMYKGGECTTFVELRFEPL